VYDDCLPAFMHASYCIALGSDIVQMVEILKIAYGTTWKSKRRSWIKMGEEVGLY
jgi:hypothetical protein